MLDVFERIVEEELQLGHILDLVADPPRLLRRLPAPSVPMSRLAEELPGIMFRKAGMTE